MEHIVWYPSYMPPLEPDQTGLILLLRFFLFSALSHITCPKGFFKKLKFPHKCAPQFCVFYCFNLTEYFGPLAPFSKAMPKDRVLNLIYMGYFYLSMDQTLPFQRKVLVLSLYSCKSWKLDICTQWVIRYFLWQNDQIHFWSKHSCLKTSMK